jgi:hypothetical protein
MIIPLKPEIFLLLGIDLFLAISLLLTLIDKHFPWHLPYLNQAAALAGFGQLIISKEFTTFFDEYMRFWFSFLYIMVALGNIVAINIYLGYVRKIINHAKAFMLTVSFPSFAAVSFFMANYFDFAQHPLIMLQQSSLKITFIGLIALDIFVLGFSIYLFFEPEGWRIIAGGVTAIIVVIMYTLWDPSSYSVVSIGASIGLAIACVIVIILSVYILVRAIRVKMKKKKKRR